MVPSCEGMTTGVPAETSTSSRCARYGSVPSATGNTYARSHQRDEKVGTWSTVSTAATLRPRRPSDRTVTSDCRNRAFKTSASNVVRVRSLPVPTAAGELGGLRVDDVTAPRRSWNARPRAAEEHRPRKSRADGRPPVLATISLSASGLGLIPYPDATLAAVAVVLQRGGTRGSAAARRSGDCHCSHHPSACNA